MKKYIVKHKLTKKPVRDTKTLEIITFDTSNEAQQLADLKNKIMGASFYAVETK